MALEDLFRGMKAGTDMYFQPKDEALNLARKRLALAGLIKDHVDEEYLKPSELADKLARHQYNKALADANTNTLSQVRPLQDAYDASRLNLGTNQNTLANTILGQTADTQIQTSVAKAGNDLYQQTNVRPAEQQKQQWDYKLGAQDAKTNFAIGRQSQGDKINTGVANAITNANVAQTQAEESAIARQFITNNPELVKRDVLNKIGAAIDVNATLRINSAEGAAKTKLEADKRKLWSGIMASSKGHDITAVQLLENAVRSNNPDIRDAAVAIYMDMEEQEQTKTRNDLKTQQNQENDIIASQILTNPDDVFKMLYKADPQRGEDGKYLINGQQLTTDELRAHLATQMGVLTNLYDLAYKKKKAESDTLDLNRLFGAYQ